MHEVFISHSKFDKKVADAICHILESKDIRCWIAPRDEQAGRDFSEQLEQAIKDSKILVLVASENSNKSSHVRREINIAASKNIIIIPFKIDESDREGGYSYYITNVHWIDAFPEPEHHFSRLIKDISVFLKKEFQNKDIDDIEYIKERNKEKLIATTKEERLSFGLSLITRKKTLIDHCHTYRILKRVDVIEDASFSSYRWLTIRNDSTFVTSFITHKESGENKVTFDSMKVRAYRDNFKGDKLIVKSSTKIQPNFEQVFKIFFENPLMPGEEIKIFYRFNWPGEPIVYYTERQSQSISLTRYEKGVEQLIYGIFEKERLIDLSLVEIDPLYKECKSEILPRHISIEEDVDFSPLHSKGYKGVYYNIPDPKGIGYRIYYRTQKNMGSKDDDDIF